MVSMSLGLPLNLLLMWVVACKSPEELRVYKKVLLSTTVIDTAFLAMCFLVQPVIILTLCVKAHFILFR